LEAVAAFARSCCSFTFLATASAFFSFLVNFFLVWLEEVSWTLIRAATS
jgi:hypothetical protein